MGEPAASDCSPLQVARAVVGISYPATTADIIEHVRSHGAQPQILRTLESLGPHTFYGRDELLDRVTARRQRGQRR